MTSMTIILFLLFKKLKWVKFWAENEDDYGKISTFSDTNFQGKKTTVSSTGNLQSANIGPFWFCDDSGRQVC